MPARTRCGNFQQQVEKSRSHGSAAARSGEKCLTLRTCPAQVVGVLLAIHRAEHYVFRATVLSIVLTLAILPHATLLCRAWCDSQADAPIGCHHEDRATSLSVVADGHSCDNVVIGAAFVREDVRRDVSSPDQDQGIPVPRYQIACSTIDARLGQEHGRQRSIDTRPPVTALRI